MTIPGVDVTSAATLMAAIGEITRFPATGTSWGISDSMHACTSPATPRTASADLKARLSPARHVLVEAARAAIKTPGPLRAFYQRIRAHRGAQIAIVAAARKLAVLSWQLLTKREDYAVQALHTRREEAPRHRATHRRAPTPKQPAKRAEHREDQLWCRHLLMEPAAEPVLLERLR